MRAGSSTPLRPSSQRRGRRCTAAFLSRQSLRRLSLSSNPGKPIDIPQTIRRGLRWVVDNYTEQLLRLYPPYLGAGIRVDAISDDFRHVEVRMPLTACNQNYVGTQFGGSLYSMCDPFYMLMLMNNLGSDYIVWDKAASVRFRKPGTGTVYATFDIDQADIDRIRRRADDGGKVEPVFEVEVVNETGEVVAEVTKTLHVRRKDGS